MPAKLPPLQLAQPDPDVLPTLWKVLWPAGMPALAFNTARLLSGSVTVTAAVAVPRNWGTVASNTTVSEAESNLLAVFGGAGVLVVGVVAPATTLKLNVPVVGRL